MAGLKRETPDRPEPGVPQVLSEGVGKLARKSHSGRSGVKRGGGDREPGSSLWPHLHEQLSGFISRLNSVRFGATELQAQQPAGRKKVLT